MPFQSKRWHVLPAMPPEHLQRFPHLNPLALQVMYNRGLSSPAEVSAFVERTVGTDDNPFSMGGVNAAVTRLRSALRNKEPIAIYGDFDADGVTATVLLVQTLRALGGDVRPYIPHRVDEGYGLNKDALAELAAAGVRVVVTVDCGVRSVPEVAFGRSQGLDFIITDHHSVGPELPPALAVVNPKNPTCLYPFKELAGVGVAFKLAQALLRSNRSTPVTANPPGLEEQDLLDLVALGTVADLVPLLGENRALVQQGLERLNRSERPGIEALVRWSGLRSGQVDAEAIGYSLAPRLNAAGRLSHAKLAYQLLLASYPAEADMLAGELDRLNRERQRLTVETLDRARAVVLSEQEDSSLLFVAAPDFLAGIVGLVAGRLSEEFYRPTVIMELGEQESRGSARSIAEFHITEALDRCVDLLVRHGGHSAAAGFTVRNEHMDEVRCRLQAQADQALRGTELRPMLVVDAEVGLNRMTWELFDALEPLKPYGYANPQPLFVSRHVRVDRSRVVGSKGNHLKLQLSDGHNVWDGIAFRQGEWANRLPDYIDIAYHLEVNRWNGELQLQLNIEDISVPCSN